MINMIDAYKLGKNYRRWRNEWQRFASWFTPVQPQEETWVLKDINFSVKQGESIGIIGQNGAGKSTLLKLITGTIYPSQGYIKLNGRVAGILELSMGFNENFTGRENAYHVAGLMGYSRSQIQQVISYIERFAEIGDYFDQAVRTYSSGMLMRLAFSVVTAIRPDILIVDEALSVGDIYFQQKCYERIKHFVKEGTTLLFVTHCMGTILNLCSRALLLRKGELIYDGQPKDVINLYQSDLIVGVDKNDMHLTIQSVSHNSDEIKSLSTAPQIANITSEVIQFLQGRFLNQNGSELNTIMSDQLVTLELKYQIDQDLHDPHIGFVIKNRFGVVIFETNTYCMKHSIGKLNRGNIIVVKFSFLMRLIADQYTVTAGFANNGYGEGFFKESLGYLHEVISFTVVPNIASIQWSGLVNLSPHVTFEKYEEMVV